MNRLLTIARLEFSTVSRQRWVRLFAVAFTVLTVATSYASGALQELTGADSFERTTVALVPLVLALAPLAALLLGVSGQGEDSGCESFLFAQPVTRFEVILGRWLGEAAALTAALAAGFGAGALLIASGGGSPAGLPRFLFFFLVSALLAAVFLSLAALVSAAIRRRQTALGLAAFVWFLSVLLYDGLAIAAAGWLTGRTGARVLFLSVFGNPSDLSRVLALTLSGTPHVLGAAGDSWMRFLGGPAAAGALSGSALLTWLVLPLAASRAVIARRDL
jgi:Cu-processing system permease protein